MMGSVTAFALAFVDDGIVVLVILGQHSPLVRFCSDFAGDISTKGFLSLCIYETAVVDDDYRKNNAAIEILHWQYYRQMYKCLSTGNYGISRL
jgi:hypothetical protein